MCGIIAYSGKQSALPLVIEGLKKLEYRGYDSWGVGGQAQDGHLFVAKKIGSIGDMAALDISKFPRATVGIGHTRWATHGRVTVKNAHPHFSMNKKIVLAHNGIVENEDELRQELIKKGYIFRSQTDTEVIANVIEEFRKKCPLIDAVRFAMPRLKGRNAIVVLEADNPTLVAARNGSPLIVGAGKDETFIASDIPAFLKHTRHIYYLDNGQMVVVHSGKSRFYSLHTGNEIKRRLVTVDFDVQDVEKGEYKHFMLKEIMDQKETLRRAVAQDEKQLKIVAEMIKKAYGSFFVGCGSAGVVCHLSEYIFAHIAGRHTNYIPASEFKYFGKFLTSRSLMIVVSQSGETADVLEAIEVAKQKKSKVIGILNNTNSTIGRLADYVFPVNAGHERAVASTKATTAQYAVITLLAYAVQGNIAEGKRRLVEVAGQVNELLNPRYEQHIKQIARVLSKQDHIYIIGRGKNVPIARECSIKLQEVSYIHAESFVAGELKHGPLALVTNGTPVLVLCANDQSVLDIISNAQEVKARGGVIIGVGPVKYDIFDYWLHVPDVGELSYLVNVIPVQLLAYHLGVMRGVNPDKPRNLAKSVTVK